MPEFPIPSARILLVSQIQGGRLPPLPTCPVRLWQVRLSGDPIMMTLCRVRAVHYTAAVSLPRIDRASVFVHCSKTAHANL